MLQTGSDLSWVLLMDHLPIAGLHPLDTVGGREKKRYPGSEPSGSGDIRRPQRGFHVRPSAETDRMALMTRFEWSSALISGCGGRSSRLHLTTPDGFHIQRQADSDFPRRSGPVRVSVASRSGTGGTHMGHSTARMAARVSCSRPGAVPRRFCMRPVRGAVGTRASPCRARVPVASLLCPITDAGCTDMRRVRVTDDHRINRGREQDKKSGPGRNSVEWRFSL